VELIRRFPPETFATAMESWAWIGELEGKVPRLASMFGDVFLEGADGFWFLDTIEGTLTRRWPDAASLQADVNNAEARDQLLMPGLVAAAADVGLVPGEQQVLAFKVPPVLGGEVSADNLDLLDFLVAMHINGEIHRQVKDLPPGTPISGITVDGERP
jgi:hypothetical protein